MRQIYQESANQSIRERTSKTGLSGDFPDCLIRPTHRRVGPVQQNSQLQPLNTALALETLSRNMGFLQWKAGGLAGLRSPRPWYGVRTHEKALNGNAGVYHRGERRCCWVFKCVPETICAAG